jgi:putative ABC transport system permease protein
MMWKYHLQLAIRNLGRNRVLTALMVLAIAVGIGAAMTTLTVLRLLSGDPLPGRSQQIFYPQIDPRPADQRAHEPYDKLDYTSALDLWQAARGERQALVVTSEIKLHPQQARQRALLTPMLATTADFFPMFAVPFAHGSGWSAADDKARARVAVISDDLNQRLFAGANSVGRSLRLGDAEMRIVGVLAPWRPSPQFYSLAGGRYSQGDTAAFYDKPQQVMLPFFTGLDINAGNIPYWTCWADTTAEQRRQLLSAPCVWLQLWVQLGTPARVDAYRQYLAQYASQQQTLGRIGHPDKARLLSLMQWLDLNQVVPADVRLQSGVALAFLLICLCNSVALLLATFLRRNGEIGLRRALGASRRAIFAHCLAEAGLIGLIGGTLGWLLTLLGLWAIRHQPLEYAELIQLDLPMLAATFAMAVLASLLAGLLPALRASRIAPALQLKSL